MKENSANNIILSVIIPIYNAEKFLEDCLESLINQDFKLGELEVICVNDGSVDRSLDILFEYKNTQF